MKILLVDDHAVVRSGLRRLFAMRFRRAKFGEASDAAAALAAVQREPWDVVLLDLSLSDRHGLEALRDIRKVRPGLRVLVLTMHGEEQFGVAAVKAGAAGYLTKSCSPEELLQAIRDVRAGRSHLPASVMLRLGDVSGAAHDRLSPRELVVLRQLGAGKTTKEIADALDLSVKTVSTYHTRLLGKMGLQTTAQLVRYVREHGLL